MSDSICHNLSAFTSVHWIVQMDLKFPAKPIVSSAAKDLISQVSVLTCRYPQPNVLKKLVARSVLLVHGLQALGKRSDNVKYIIETLRDLFLLLEDLEWSYLKEIFSEIKPWTENVFCWERATWLEFRGIPLHCWNSTTLKNLAGLWGKFEALGCNADHKRDCEKVTILISTKHIGKIEEVLELEVGDRVVEISVVEIGFSETSTAVGDRNVKTVIGSNKNKHEYECSYQSSSDQPGREAAEDDQSSPGSKEEALKAMCTEKEINDDLNREVQNSRGLINVEELMGGKSQDLNTSAKEVKDKKDNNGKGGEVLKSYRELDNLSGGVSWAELVRLGVDNVAGPEPQVEDLIDSEQHTRGPSFLVQENMTNMGLNPNIQSGSKSWAEVLEDNMVECREVIKGFFSKYEGNISNFIFETKKTQGSLVEGGNDGRLEPSDLHELKMRILEEWELSRLQKDIWRQK
ncbi:hypothetical protein V6N13_046757 [Hibiscus sabdariffa]